MPRTTEDFDGIDQGEQKNVSYGFGNPGEQESPLAPGEIIESVTFQMAVVSGTDPDPSGCLNGAPAIQPGGIVITQSVTPQVAGVVYLIMATATTTSTPAQILKPWSHLPCNPLPS